MKIGVPRALDFFRFHPSWAVFFEQFDVELVVSPPTTRATLEEGQRYAVPESCLPLKLYYGHVRALVGEVDALLVPSFHRVAPESTNCAKLIGLPDLLRATMSDLPPLIAPDIDLSQGVRSLLAMVLELGTVLTHNPLALRDAAFAAWAAYLRSRAAMLEGELTPAGFDGRTDVHLPAGDPAVAVLGHPYNLYDPFVNHNLLARLARMGVAVLVPERLGPWPAADYWTFEYELVGAAYLALAREGVAGIVAVVPFGCGPDGVMVETVRLLAAEASVPILVLTLDEHAGEAGLVTRIEAFVDMLNWKGAGRGESLSRD
jgi:predicted nucleotide-binding protein (sugar kinase/HSP70/actin superfamily)